MVERKIVFMASDGVTFSTEPEAIRWETNFELIDALAGFERIDAEDLMRFLVEHKDTVCNWLAYRGKGWTK